MNGFSFEDWMDKANCGSITDKNIFFPDAPNPWPAIRKARQICGECTVRSECMGYALRHNIREGIYGGAMPEERLDLHQRFNRRKTA